jgi:hypothetical protein
MNPMAAEQLRQERETFELNKRQAAHWFDLRLRMGYSGLVMLVVLAGLCGFVILNHNAYPATVIDWAVALLAGDIIALLVTTWKLVLSPTSVVPLSPVTWVK